MAEVSGSTVSLAQQVALARTLKAFGWKVIPSPEANAYLDRLRKEDDIRRQQKHRRRIGIPAHMRAAPVDSRGPISLEERKRREKALAEKNAQIMRERAENDALRKRRRSDRKR